MTKSQLFTRAHAIAKTLEGDYRARFSYALSVAWKEVKMKKNKKDEVNKYFKLTREYFEQVQEKKELNDYKATEWKAGEQERIYFSVIRNKSKKTSALKIDCGYLDLKTLSYVAPTEGRYTVNLEEIA